MLRSAGLCVCVCGIKIGIKSSKPSKPSGINFAGITICHTNLNSADADAKSHWTHHNECSLVMFTCDYCIFEWKYCHFNIAVFIWILLHIFVSNFAQSAIFIWRATIKYFVVFLSMVLLSRCMDIDETMVCAGVCGSNEYDTCQVKFYVFTFGAWSASLIFEAAIEFFKYVYKETPS